MSDYEEDFAVLAIENERLMAEVERLRKALATINDRNAALEAAHAQMQANLDRAYADRATYRVTVAWMRDEIERLRAALQKVLDDPVSVISADMRFGIMQILNRRYE